MKNNESFSRTENGRNRRRNNESLTASAKTMKMSLVKATSNFCSRMMMSIERKTKKRITKMIREGRTKSMNFLLPGHGPKNRVPEPRSPQIANKKSSSPTPKSVWLRQSRVGIVGLEKKMKVRKDKSKRSNSYSSRLTPSIFMRNFGQKNSDWSMNGPLLHTPCKPSYPSYRP